MLLQILRWFSFKVKILYLITLSLLFASCSTVTEVKENLPAPSPMPLFKVLNFSPTDSDKPDPTDYKYRESSSSKIEIGVVRQLAAKDIVANLQELALRMIERRIVESGANVTDLSNRWNVSDDDVSNAELAKSLNLDAVLILTSDNNKEEDKNEPKSFTASAKMIDPVNFNMLAEYQSIARLVDKRIDSAHQSEIRQDRGSLLFLTGRSYPLIDIKLPSREEGEDILRSCVTAYVNLISGVPNVTAYLYKDDKPVLLGKLPLMRVRIPEGKQKIKVQRDGFAPLVREVTIRAGKKRELFFSWGDDDKRSSSLAVVTSPVDLVLSLDNSAKGETPVYITGLAGGSYNLELSQAGTKGVLPVAAGEVNLLPGQNYKLYWLSYHEKFESDFLSRDYWDLTSSSGTVKPVTPALSNPNEHGGLAFKIKRAASEASSGILSKPIAADDFDMELTLPPISSESYVTIGLLSEPDAVMMEVKGGLLGLYRFASKESKENPRYFRAKAEPDKSVRLGFSYRKQKEMLTILVDGGKVLSFPVRLSDTVKLWITTNPVNGDGRLLVQELLVKSRWGGSQK